MVYEEEDIFIKTDTQETSMKILSLRTLWTLSVILTVYLCMDCTNGRAIDEIIASASSTDSDFDLLVNETGDVILTELDMLLSVEQFNTLYGKQNSFNSTSPKTRRKRKALNDVFKRWTNKQVPYRITPSTFSESDIEAIMAAIAEWQTHTCITFREATSSDSNFVNFKDVKGCSSHVGMNKDEQLVSLGDGCRYKGIIVHEIGHAVGFFHEQNRPDRDDHVVIKHENIIPESEHNFWKYKWSDVSSYDVPYDYKSIMHYRGRDFSMNGQNTIVTINPEFQDVIGNSEGLSFNDIKLANLMYNCSESCNSSIRCPNEGFVGKDCQCWCPGNPIDKCVENNNTERSTVTPTVRPTVTPTVRQQ